MTTYPEKLFVYSPALEEGGYPAECPFNTHRAGRTRETLASMGLLSGPDRGEQAPVSLSDDELFQFHTETYVDALRKAGDGTLPPFDALAFGLGTPDCPMFPGMLDYATLAAGGTVTAARAVLAGTRIAFNPSGGFHHAMPERAAGFCYLNDIVLGALALAAAGKRVLFLDIDVHHCDGVQHAFYSRADIMTISVHESGETLFPGTGPVSEIGEGEGTGYTVNLPLPVGTHDAAYRKVVRSAVLPLIPVFDPDVIMVELGMDALSGDPLAHLHLTNNTHADVLADLLAFEKPIVATGGGGYHIENTVRGWALSWSVLCGDQDAHDDLMLGMGGVMMETTEWSGGLRDRVLLSDAGKRGTVTAAVDAVIQEVREKIFPCHGLPAA